MDESRAATNFVLEITQTTKTKTKKNESKCK